MPAPIGRRQLLVSGSAALLAVASPAIAETPKSGFRALAFDNLHTGEKLNVDYWIDGAYVPDALHEIDHVLRDFRTGDVHPIAPGLLDLLHRLHTGLGSSDAFAVISGYRSPATNAKLHEQSSGVAVKSLHMEGMAIDVRLPDQDLSALREAALALRGGGVGYYPKSNFVHVDIGRVRQW